MTRNSRIVGLAVLVAALLQGGAAAAQERPKVDIFAGGGLLIHEGGPTSAAHAGGGFWATQHLRVGGLTYGGNWFGLSVHLRLPMGDETDLLVGTTPVWYWHDEVVVTPAVEALLSRRLAPPARVEFGATLDLTDAGGYIHALARLVYSFG